MLDIYPSRIAIFTLTGWTFVSFDVKNLTEVLKLGTQTSYRSSSEHPKCDSEIIQKKKEKKKGSLGISVLLTSGCLST